MCGSFVDHLNTLIPTYKEHDPSEGPESKGEKLIRFLLEKSAKLEQMRYIKNITILQIKKGEKIYDLNKSFNLVIRGKLRNNFTRQEYDRVTPFADFPLQINLNVKKSEDPFLTEEQKWQDRLDIEALEHTYLLRLHKSNLSAELE